MSSQRPGRGRKRSHPSSSSGAGPSRSLSLEEVEDELEEFTLTQGGASSQAASSNQKHFDQLEIGSQKQMIVDMVRHLLCSQGKKVPIKRKVLLDEVMGEHRKSFPEVFERANEELQSVFGLKAVEIFRTGSKSTSAQAAAPIASSKSYMLVSTLDPEYSGFIKRSKLDRAELGLLCVVLSLVMMKQGGISEDQLWNCLDRLGISQERRHALFGDVKRLITMEFVSQMYLEREKVVAGDKHSFTIRWGPRSKEEVDKKAMLAFVAEIYEGDIEQWKAQFGDLLK